MAHMMTRAAFASWLTALLIGWTPLPRLRILGARPLAVMSALRSSGVKLARKVEMESVRRDRPRNLSATRRLALLGSSPVDAGRTILVAKQCAGQNRHPSPTRPVAMEPVSSPDRCRPRCYLDSGWS